VNSRKSVDWDIAFAFYAGLPPARRQFSVVGRRFGVSDTAVRKQALRRGWLERVRDLDARARRKVDTTIVRDRAREIGATLEIIGLAESALVERLRSGEAEVRLADLPSLVRLRELLLDESTERIALAEVRDVLNAAFSVAGRFVPRDRRQDFLEELTKAVGGVVPLSPPAAEIEARGHR
jgi:hypothetical protein